MVDYRLVLDGLAAFVVDITSTSGSRSMRRFPTEAAALMWIAEQGFHDAAAEAVQESEGNQLSHDRLAVAEPIGDFTDFG
jgi:hypothetical protein